MSFLQAPAAAAPPPPPPPIAAPAIAQTSATALQAAAAASGKGKGGTIKTGPQGAPAPDTTNKMLIPAIAGTKNVFGS